MPTKTCPKCQVVKPLDSFSADRHKSSGYKSYCRSCEATRCREAYARLHGPVRSGPPQVNHCACGVAIALTAEQCRGCWLARVKFRTDEERRTKSHYYIHADVRRAVYERDDYVCHLCGCYVDTLCGHNDGEAPTLDHVIPRSLGGSHGFDNLRTAHRSCNGKRGNRDIA